MAEVQNYPAQASDTSTVASLSADSSIFTKSMMPFSSWSSSSRPCPQCQVSVVPPVLCASQFHVMDSHSCASLPPLQSQHPPIVCYVCGTLGNIAPHCPNRCQSQDADNGPSVSPSRPLPGLSGCKLDLQVPLYINGLPYQAVVHTDSVTETEHKQDQGHLCEPPNNIKNPSLSHYYTQQMINNGTAPLDEPSVQVPASSVAFAGLSPHDSLPPVVTAPISN